jgi:hypothetical protein
MVNQIDLIDDILNVLIRDKVYTQREICHIIMDIRNKFISEQMVYNKLNQLTHTEIDIDYAIVKRVKMPNGIIYYCLNPNLDMVNK